MPFTTEEKNEIVENFLKLVRTDSDFDLINTRVENPNCGVWLGPRGHIKEDVPCLAVARDSLGNWSVVTADGYTRQYLATEIA